MLTLFLYYKVSFIVSIISGASLAQLGKHFFSRGIILEVFFLSQLVLLGNLISKLFFVDPHFESFGGVFLSLALFFIGKYLLFKKKFNGNDQGTFMVGGYLFLLSIQYLLIGVFPQLDSHMSIGFLGSMVTASGFENLLMNVIFILYIFIYYLNRTQINKSTIEINILQVEDKSVFELLLFSIPLVVSLYCLGFLYTMSFLLLPSLILGREFSSEKKAVMYLGIISAICSILGLGLSIYFERLSTTSTQIFLLVLTLSFLKFARVSRS